MEQPKFYMLFVAALIPMVIGSLWYSDKVLGKSWMKSAGLKKSDLEGGNVALILGVAYVFSVLIAFMISGMTNHQTGIMQLLVSEPGFGEAGSEVQNYYENFLSKYGNKHRDFGHGAVHGIIAAIGLALPMVGMNALFERRGWKYIMIHFGYWLITLTLMGGVLCQFM